MFCSQTQVEQKTACADTLTRRNAELGFSLAGNVEHDLVQAVRGNTSELSVLPTCFLKSINSHSKICINDLGAFQGRGQDCLTVVTVMLILAIRARGPCSID